MKLPAAIAPLLLKGRLALITGAGQGNGRALALGLSQAGARVIATDMNEATVHETADLVRAEGGEAWSYVLDVSSADACDALAERVKKEVGIVDLLVNNAGVCIRENFSSPRAKANWAKTFDVNVHGTFNVCQAWLEGLKDKKGTIVNVASIAAFAGHVGLSGYSASKGAIKLYTQTLAGEMAPFGVRVNALAPGVIETPMTASTRENPERMKGFMGRIPLGRIGQTDDLIGPVIFLSSDMSRYVTGITLAADGGYLAI